jgi:hypothetical protein
VWMLWRFEQFTAFEKAEVQIQRDHDIKQRFVYEIMTDFHSRPDHLNIGTGSLLPGSTS